MPAVTKALERLPKTLSEWLRRARRTPENLCQPLAEVDDALGRIFPVSHLNSVKNSPELREAYEQTLPLLSEYSTGLDNMKACTKRTATCVMAIITPP